ncbi:MAG: hypothetical protein AB8F78_00010 [Saprospiraceae bacterium]
MRFILLFISLLFFGSIVIGQHMCDHVDFNLQSDNKTRITELARGIYNEVYSSGLLNSPYTLDSTRTEFLNDTTGVLHTRRTLKYLRQNDSTVRRVYRSWGPRAYFQGQGNFEIYQTETSSGRKFEAFNTDIITNINTRDYIAENFNIPSLRQTRSKNTQYNPLTGVANQPSYSALDTTNYSDGIYRRESWITDANYTPTSLSYRRIIKFDNEGREIEHSLQVQNFNNSSPYDSILVTQYFITYTDGQGDNYTYTKNETVNYSRPSLTETGSYVYSTGSILHSNSRTVDGETNPVSTQVITSTVDAAGNVTEATSILMSNGTSDTTRQTYRYLAGTDLVIKADFFEGSKPLPIESQWYFYTQQASSLAETIPITTCKLKSGNVGPASFQAASAPFKATYQLIDLKGRILQTTTRNEGQRLHLIVPSTPGLYYLFGQSATERCVTKLLR